MRELNRFGLAFLLAIIAVVIAVPYLEESGTLVTLAYCVIVSFFAACLTIGGKRQ